MADVSLWTSWAQALSWKEPSPVASSPFTDWANARTYTTAPAEAYLRTALDWVPLRSAKIRTATGWVSLYKPQNPAIPEMEPLSIAEFFTETSSSASTGNVNLTRNVPAGSTIIVFALSAGGSDRAFTVSDSKSLDWEPLIAGWPSITGGSAHTIAAWYAVTPTALTMADTIQVGVNATTVLGMNAFSLTGANVVTPISQVVSNSGGPIADLILPPVATPPAGVYLVLGGIGSIGATFTTDPSELILDQVVSNAASTRRMIAYTKKSTSHTGIEARQSASPPTQQTAIAVGVAPSVIAPADPGEVVHMWVGAPIDDSVVIHTRTLQATSCRMMYSSSSDFPSSRQYSSPVVPDEYGIVRHVITGLTPNTRYYFRLTDTPPGSAEVFIGPTGTIKTLQTPGVAHGTRKIIVGGCLQTNAPETAGLDAALAWAPDWGHFNGDFFYNGNSNLMTEAEWVQRYNSQISNVADDALKHFLAAGLGAYELVSDHDTTHIDNGDSNLGSAPYELAGWRKSVPHLVGSGDATCRDQQWDDGRVSYFMTDSRSAERSSGSMPDGPTKTMLGAAQKTRLMEWLANNPSRFKVIITDPPWMGAADIVAKPDAWWSYAFERQEIITAINAQEAHVEIWHGDSHLIGYATPEKNTWGNIPVICSAPYWQAGGGRNRNTFSEFFNNSSEWAAVFGRITIMDNGGSITRTYEGYDALSEEVKFTYTTTVFE